jgi:hypothetical protein
MQQNHPAEKTPKETSAVCEIVKKLANGCEPMPLSSSGDRPIHVPGFRIVHFTAASILIRPTSPVVSHFKLQSSERRIFSLLPAMSRVGWKTAMPVSRSLATGPSRCCDVTDPYPGILAARRSGAIMDKSGRRLVFTFQSREKQKTEKRTAEL